MLYALSVHARCMLAFNIVLLCALMIRAALLMLPKDSPNAIYARGRITEGQQRLCAALNRTAAARYIADRR